ncbi:hypothetical protein WME76_09815 [Sorangium sp. So ce119]|uniref:hypothetical protein n=1 Tax=Sorangium sp. So ce119 TaxID=3133279 RepID=UPI003F64381F
MMDVILAPLDRLRRACFRLLGRHVGTWVARRDVRVSVLGTIAVVTALSGALLAPTWLLALGPIVLGVPHVLADVRYLVARPGLHRRGLAALAVAAPLAAGAVTSRLACGLLAAVAAAFVARGTRRRRAVAIACLAPLVCVAMAFRGLSELVFAHAHNAIAVGLWCAWRPRRTRWHLVPLALFLGSSAALATGLLDPLWRAAAAALPGLGAPIHAHVRDIAPRAPGDLGVRLVLLYAFAQSVHYAVWLRLVPEDDRPRPAPRGFVSSWRALADDLGRPLLWLTAAAALALIAWACFDLLAARAGYLRFAVFHGHLELAAATWLFIERRWMAGAGDPGQQRGSPSPRCMALAPSCA